MKKLFSILTLSAIFGIGAAAQQQGAEGNMQASLILGNNPMFNQSTTYLLADQSSSSTGLYSAPGYYLNLGTVGSNQLTNMVGVQFAYFLSPSIEVNAMFSMNISSTPKKDYQEGVSALAPSSKEIDGELKTNWYANVGGNYHFFSKHISPYAGARVGGMMGRIQTTAAYDGDEAVITKTSNSGQIRAIQGSLVGGVDCVLNCGVVLGLEIAPVSYQYSVIEIDPSGSHNYTCNHHNIKVFSTPTLKLGFRF